MASSSASRVVWLRIGVLVFALILWFTPAPEGVTVQAWHLFAIFISAIFAGSGYLTPGEMYRNGGLITFSNLLIFLVIGSPWILLVT